MAVLWPFANHWIYARRYYSWFYTNRFISSIALNGFDDEAKEKAISVNDADNSSRHNKMLIASAPPHNNDLLYLDDDLCLDLVFNFLVSHITREGPIKVTQRKRSGSFATATNRLSNGEDTTAQLGFKSRQRCFSTLINTSFGYLPLVKSQMRLDPVLFKDSVSNMRKKYRKIEQVIWIECVMHQILNFYI